MLLRMVEASGGGLVEVEMMVVVIVAHMVVDGANYDGVDLGVDRCSCRTS